MVPNVENVRIEQTLHGYSDGHRLLASSVRLSKEAERKLLIMSDMSGPNMVRGFENYVTGYPVDAGFYALSKTWYAPEMKRPGCVWTHTLLIGFNDLSLVDNLSSILRYFKHPDVDKSFTSYNSSLEITTNYFQYNYSNSLITLAPHIIEALYAFPENPIFISSGDSQQYETLLIEIWNQQWPKLRNSFCFCTGSIANRKINSKIFDIQVIPSETERQIAREIPNGIFIDTTDTAYSNASPSWVVLAAKGLCSATSFRKMLWKLGAFEEEGRKSFVKLTEIVIAIQEIKQNISSLSKLTDLVSHLFPKSNECTGLKSFIYGGGSRNYDDLFPVAEENDLLKELLTTGHHASFDSESLNLRERALTLWISDKRTAQEFALMVIRSEVSPLGEEFLAGIANGLKPSDLVAICRELPHLCYIFLSLNPSLAASSIIWEQLSNRKRDLLDVVSKSKYLTSLILSKIIRSILGTHVRNIAKDVFVIFGDSAISSFMDQFDSLYLNSNKAIPDLFEADNVLVEWQEALKSRTDNIIHWLRRRKQPGDFSLIFLSNVLDPNSEEVIKLGTGLWLPLMEKNNPDVNKNALIRTEAFLLALGFNNPDQEADKLVSFSFEDVHDAAGRNNLDYDAWRPLEKQVPSLGWWENWDKCDRLRRALVTKFLENNWREEAFINSAKRGETFHKLVALCAKTSAGRSFIQSIRNQVMHGQLPATAEQTSILRGFEDKMRNR